MNRYYIIRVLPKGSSSYLYFVEYTGSVTPLFTFNQKYAHQWSTLNKLKDDIDFFGDGWTNRNIEIVEVEVVLNEKVVQRN